MATVSRAGAVRDRPAVDSPEYRMFGTEVVRTERLSASFLRVTLGGDDLRRFGVGGHDQRIKLVLPPTPGMPVELDHGPDWYVRWRAKPDGVRPHLRTYTVRAARPHRGELDVDVVLHGIHGHATAGSAGPAGPAGPAASWAAGARPGDPLVLLGPDRPGRGRAWGVEWSPPSTARWLLLAGDETAVPAIGAIVEALPPGVAVTACLEVPDPSDAQPWGVPASTQVRWSFRGDRPHGALLTAAVRRAVDAHLGELRPGVPQQVEDVDVDAATLWDVPDPVEDSPLGAYAWLAGEAAVIKGLRRHLVSTVGLPRGEVAFMGYWRRGRAEGA